jgi:hypothetical protein
MSGKIKHFAHFEPCANIMFVELSRKEDRWKQACHFRVGGKQKQSCSMQLRTWKIRCGALVAIPAITGKRLSPSLICRDSRYPLQK